MLWYLPIESLEERYSAQWARWFPVEFRRRGIHYAEISGVALCDTVQVGTFLDINSTIFWKSTQIQKISHLFYSRSIQDGDVFFLADTEMFGMEATIKYLAQLNGIDVRIYGFAHAGSYTRFDFVEKCANHAYYIEQSWKHIFDKIFVGSEYHKHQLGHMRHIPEDRVEVTGNPYDIDEVTESISFEVKRKRVIHTNRPDPEKDPTQTLDVFEILKERHPDWEFMVTTGRKQWGFGDLRQRALDMQDRGVIEVREGLTKFQYLQLLSQSQVMTGNTREENFGYCILEAMIFDTIPVIENAFSHPELVEGDLRCLFGTISDDQVEKIEAAMANPFPVKHHADQYRDSLSKVVDLITK